MYQFDENEYTGDSQLVNSVYVDNSSLEVYHSRLKDDGRSGMVVKLSWYGSQEPIDVHVQVRLASIAFLFSDDSYGAHNSIRRAY